MPSRRPLGDRQVQILSEEGIEMQFAVNVLAYYRLMMGLLPVLSASGRGRVVNVGFVRSKFGGFVAAFIFDMFEK